MPWWNLARMMITHRYSSTCLALMATKKARSLAASGNSAWGGPVDAEVVAYLSKVIELAHPDVRNVCERLRDDAAQAEFSIVVDDSDTCNVHRTHSAVTAISFANTTRHRGIVMKRQSAPNEYDRIPPDHPLYEQLTYSMYCWFGEKGWHSGCAGGRLCQLPAARTCGWPG